MQGFEDLTMIFIVESLFSWQEIAYSDQVMTVIALLRPALQSSFNREFAEPFALQQL